MCGVQSERHTLPAFLKYCKVLQSTAKYCRARHVAPMLGDGARVCGTHWANIAVACWGGVTGRDMLSRPCDAAYTFLVWRKCLGRCGVAGLSRTRVKAWLHQACALHCYASCTRHGCIRSVCCMPRALVHWWCWRHLRRRWGGFWLVLSQQRSGCWPGRCWLLASATSCRSALATTADRLTRFRQHFCASAVHQAAYLWNTCGASQRLAWSALE